MKWWDRRSVCGFADRQRRRPCTPWSQSDWLGIWGVYRDHRKWPITAPHSQLPVSRLLHVRRGARRLVVSSSFFVRLSFPWQDSLVSVRLCSPTKYDRDTVNGNYQTGEGREGSLLCLSIHRMTIFTDKRRRSACRTRDTRITGPRHVRVSSLVFTVSHVLTSTRVPCASTFFCRSRVTGIAKEWWLLNDGAATRGNFQRGVNSVGLVAVKIVDHELLSKYIIII